MGCICSKGLLANQYVVKNHRGDKELKSKGLDVGAAGVEVDGGASDATTRLITNHRSTEDNAGSSDEGENKMAMASGLNRITNGERGAQVVAGWPSWLTAVAGEAISGWVPCEADSFVKLDKVCSIASSSCLFFFIILIFILMFSSLGVALIYM